MHSRKEQVDQLLINAEQALNFLRTVLDDLILKQEVYNPKIQEEIIVAQIAYKKHKAVLMNIRNLLEKRQFDLPQALSAGLSNSLRIRIKSIIERAIELDRLR